MKKRFAFSLIELLISLIVISCITAAFTPIITKKFSTNITNSGGSVLDITAECDQYGEHCNLCTDKICLSCVGLNCQNDEYKHERECKCKRCAEDYDTSCLTCDSDKCTTCETGKYPNGKTCADCDTKYDNCATCDETKCNTCKTNYKLDNGKCVPDCTKFFNENCTTCDELSCKTCKPNYDLVGNDCIANCTKIFALACTNCTASACTTCTSGYAVKNGTCQSCSSLFSNCSTCTATACSACSGSYILSNGSCTTCSAKFGSSCTACNSTKCTTCANGYHLSGSTCVADFSCSGSDFMKIGSLCVTRKNMGDSTALRIPSGVTVANVNQTCNSSSSNKCCWQGKTADYCDNENGGAYDGCRRTVCDWYAANYICKNFTAGGRTWRLATSSEMSNWATNSKGLGVNGLQLCDRWSGYSSAYCDNSYSCPGSCYDICNPRLVWSGTVNGSSNAYNYYLDSGSWGQNSSYRTYAFSVRCVTDL